MSKSLQEAEREDTLRHRSRAYAAARVWDVDAFRQSPLRAELEVLAATSFEAGVCAAEQGQPTREEFGDVSEKIGAAWLANQKYLEAQIATLRAERDAVEAEREELIAALRRMVGCYVETSPEFQAFWEDAALDQAAHDDPAEPRRDSNFYRARLHGEASALLARCEGGK